MKNSVKLFFALMVTAFVPNLLGAQPVDVDNRTTCDYRVKVNQTTTGGCPMGAGPVAGCPAGAVTTIIATPPPLLQVVAFGAALRPGTAVPLLVGDDVCGFPSVVTLPATHPNACAGAVTVFEYHGKLLVIR
jgi:hypothetical protein